MLDFAAGFGRNTKKLMEAGARQMIAVDLNADCVAELKRSFEGQNVTVVQNNGSDLADVEDESITFLYSFDAMVHFDLEIIAAYVPEFARVMKKNAYALIHHSNYDGNPGGDFRQNPHWRNFFNAAIMKHLSLRSGLSVEDQRIVPWGNEPIDCITILRKP